MSLESLAETRRRDERLVDDYRETWVRKPCLRETYARYHDMLLAQCGRGDIVLEIGCGIGHMSRKAGELGYRRWIATDVLAVPDTQLVCDALALPFRDASIDRIVFIDVLHHLASPKGFFREAARVLRPGRAIVCIEPWVTPFSYPIYRWIHTEGCDLSRDIEHPFAGGKSAFEGDNGIALLLCRRVRPQEWERLGFTPPVARPFNDFRWLTTRGLNRPGPDAPRSLFATAMALDELLAPFAPLLGMRALIRWERRGR